MKGTLLKDCNGHVSSKRVFGAMGLTAFFVTSIVLAVGTVRTGGDVGTNASSLLTTMAVVSGGLLGVGVVENFGNKSRTGGKK